MAQHQKKLTVPISLIATWVVNAPALKPDTEKTVQSTEWYAYRVDKGYESTVTESSASNSESQEFSRSFQLKPAHHSTVAKRKLPEKPPKEKKVEIDGMILDTNEVKVCEDSKEAAPESEVTSGKVKIVCKEPTETVNPNILDPVEREKLWKFREEIDEYSQFKRKQNRKSVPFDIQQGKAIVTDEPIIRPREIEVEGPEETFLKLNGPESMQYLLSKVKSNVLVKPHGWDEFIESRREGSEPWIAANLPRSQNNDLPKYYTDVLYYESGLDPIAWVAYFQTIKRNQERYRWTELQLGVILATYVRGIMRQTIEMDLKGDDIYNIFLFLNCLDKWELSEAKCRLKCKEIWRQRVQLPGENVQNYSCDLIYLMSLMHPHGRKESYEEKLIDRFITGLDMKYQTIQTVLAGDVVEGMSFREIVNKAQRMISNFKKDNGGDASLVSYALSKVKDSSYGTPASATNRFEMNLEGIYEVVDRQMNRTPTSRTSIQETANNQSTSSYKKSDSRKINLDPSLRKPISNSQKNQKP
jgi:hypothetical protein